MKRILIVMISLYNGGAEKSLVNMLNELPPDKYNIDLLLFKKEGMFLKQVPHWVNIIDAPQELKKLYAPIRKSGNLFFIKILGTLLSRVIVRNVGTREGFRWTHFYSKVIKRYPIKYDIAIAYTSGEPMFFVGDKVDADRKITWIHNDFKSAHHPKKYDSLYFKDFELVTISEKCAKIIREEFEKLGKNVNVIANITSSNLIHKREEEFYPMEFSSSDFKILSIGRLSYQKGFDYAIEAACILKTRGYKFKWYVIGDGNLENKLKRMIKKKNLEHFFHLLGSRENPYPYISNCDLFVQTSRFEGKSVVIDEAKIVGTPILVTRYPTVIDQIVDNVEGLIVDINPLAIANGIENMINDSELRNKFMAYLSEHDYGNQKEIKKYIDLVER